MNEQAEMTRRTLHTISHSLMVHVSVLEAYMNFLLMYTEYHIFPVLPIKDLIYEYGEPTMMFKLATDTKLSISYLRVLFCPYVVQKYTEYIYTK